MSVDRRTFLATAAAASTSLLASPLLADHHKDGEHKHGDRKGKEGGESSGDKLFKISLAQWSLHRTIRAGDLDPLDFPAFARTEFDIGAVEYVNQFFKDKARDMAYLGDMKKRGADHGVEHVLIMVDGEGQLGAEKNADRRKAVDNHVKWLEAAKFLGCHSIRVNAASSGSWDQQRDLAADGLRQLCEKAEPFGLSVLVENHGGLSSNGEWLSSVMKYVDHPSCGTLPDFGNFYIKRGDDPVKYDNYRGTDELMDFAKAVSAKTYGFDDNGNESQLDYQRLLKIVLDHGYHSWVGIEWEGSDPGEIEGVKMTKALLERVRSELG